VRQAIGQVRADIASAQMAFVLPFI